MYFIYNFKELQMIAVSSKMLAGSISVKSGSVGCHISQKHAKLTNTTDIIRAHLKGYFNAYS
jgi:hypothetical protein